MVLKVSCFVLLSLLSRVSMFRCVKLGRGNVAVSVQSCLFEIIVQILYFFKVFAYTKLKKLS